MLPQNSRLDPGGQRPQRCVKGSSRPGLFHKVFTSCRKKFELSQQKRTWGRCAWLTHVAWVRGKKERGSVQALRCPHRGCPRRGCPHRGWRSRAAWEKEKDPAPSKNRILFLLPKLRYASVIQATLYHLSWRILSNFSRISYKASSKPEKIPRRSPYRVIGS